MGIFVFIATLTAAMLVLWLYGWALGTSKHVYMGLTMTIVGLLLCIGGVVTSIIKFKMPMDWNTRKKIMLSRGHGYFAYVVMLYGQFVLSSGIINFFYFEEKYSLAKGLVAFDFILFIGLLLGGELWYQYMMRTEIPFTKVDKVMSPQEFEKRIEQGEKLVILDDMVLDVSKFYTLHPGGTFVLTHNNGRDISKFFYGGYSLDGNIGASKPA